MQLEGNYIPLPSQDRFHKASGLIRCVAAGVRSGKTFSGAIEFLTLCCENPGTDKLILSPTYKTLHAVTLREFERVLEQFPGIVHDESKGEGWIELVNGGRIYYRSAENPKSFEGLTISAFWLDEGRYIKKEAWDVLMARLSAPKAKHLAGIVTTTPAMNWLYEEFCSGKEGRVVVHFRTDENHHLPPAYLDGLRQTYSPAKYKQYVEGQWVAIEGAVFEDYDEGKHLDQLYTQADRGRKPVVHCGGDFGYHRPAALFYQRISRCKQHNTTDCIHVLKEHLPDKCDTRQLALGVADIYQSNGWEIGRFTWDPAGDAVGIGDGLTCVEHFCDREIWRSRGLNVPQVRWPTGKAQKSIRKGIEVVRSLLLNAAGETRLYIDESLKGSKRGLVKALQSTQYAESKPGRPAKDIPIVDDCKDALDSLRYPMVVEFPPHQPIVRL